MTTNEHDDNTNQDDQAPMPEGLVEWGCELMHDAYEAAAAGAGWETQEASRKPWSEVPEANRVTMRAAVTALLEELADRALLPRVMALSGEQRLVVVMDEPQLDASTHAELRQAVATWRAGVDGRGLMVVDSARAYVLEEPGQLDLTVAVR